VCSVVARRLRLASLITVAHHGVDDGVCHFIGRSRALREQRPCWYVPVLSGTVVSF
jgi:hypothetical protein